MPKLPPPNSHRSATRYTFKAIRARNPPRCVCRFRRGPDPQSQRRPADPAQPSQKLPHRPASDLGTHPHRDALRRPDTGQQGAEGFISVPPYMTADDCSFRK